MVPSLPDLIAVCAAGGGIVGAIGGFCFRPVTDRDLVKNMVDGAQLGAVFGAGVALRFGSALRWRGLNGPMHSLRRPRSQAVLAVAAVVGMMCGFTLTRLESSDLWYYVAGVAVVALATFQALRQPRSLAHSVAEHRGGNVDEKRRDLDGVGAAEAPDVGRPHMGIAARRWLRSPAAASVPIVAVAACVIVLATGSIDVLGVLVASLAALVVLGPLGLFAAGENGPIQRHAIATVEDTIASLPSELQAEFADEWREELAATLSTPIRATRVARDVRQRASRLTGESPPSTAEDGDRRQRRSAGAPGFEQRDVGRRSLAPEKWMGRHRGLYFVAVIGAVIACGTVALTKLVR